jgi:hypothetical protein
LEHVKYRVVPGWLMALDRPDDDFEAGDARLEQHLRNCGSGDDKPVTRAEPVEPRTREEYYEALRAVDGGPTDDDDAADTRTDRSGWDSVDVADRPPVDAIRVSPERTTHLLDGDADGSGGHRHGIGSPEKTEFPASWDDKKIMCNVVDVARRPDAPPVLQHWNNRWVCSGTRDSVEVSVIVLRSGEVWTAWPEEGSPGVVRNPKKGKS